MCTLDYRQTSKGWLVVQLFLFSSFLSSSASAISLSILSTSLVLEGVLGCAQYPSPSITNFSPLETIEAFRRYSDNTHVCQISWYRSKWNRPFVPSPGIDYRVITATMNWVKGGFRNIPDFKLRYIGPFDDWSGIRRLLDTKSCFRAILYNILTA